MWGTIVWVILVSMHPKRANAGPATFAACLSQGAGPICASLAASGKVLKKFFDLSKVIQPLFR